MGASKGLDFIIDDAAGGDSWSGDDAVGMTWSLGGMGEGSLEMNMMHITCIKHACCMICHTGNFGNAAFMVTDPGMWSLMVWRSPTAAVLPFTRPRMATWPRMNGVVHVVLQRNCLDYA